MKTAYTITIASVVALSLTACQQGPSPEMQELADKAAIEELLINYYSHFGGSENEDFAAYYTEDAIFDVNGIVLEGHEEIVGLYDGVVPSDGEQEQVEEAEPQEATPAGEEGQFRMVVSNIRVDIDGDTAEAEMFWTGVMNSDPYERPNLAEQGREFDQFERQEDGSWLITHRVVIADSGIPEMYRETYVPRPDFSFDAE